MSAISPDERRWDREADDLRHAGLKDLSDRATAWQGSIAALLGIASLAAFVKGPDALKDLPATMTLPGVDWTLPVPETTFWLFVIAIGLIAVAYWFAVLASQGVPEWHTTLTGIQLQAAVQMEAPKRINYLLVSRLATIAAVVAVFTGTAIIWAAQIQSSTPAKPDSFLVITGAGVFCGPLAKDGSGNITVDGGQIGDASHLIAVSSCP
jgi:hypothetical protein